MSRHCTVLVNYDAFSQSLLSEDTTPFMCRLGWRETGICSPMETILAYLGYPATFFSGTYPEKHGIWTTFWYEPEHSVFRHVPSFLIAGMDRLPNFPRRALKYALSYALRKGNPNTLLPDIPPRLLKYFGIPLKRAIQEEHPLKGIPTIFDALREAGLPFRHINPGFGGADIFTELFTAIESQAYRFIFASTVKMDKILHYNPIDSAIARDAAREMDDLMREMDAALASNYDAYDLLVISDHGMEAVVGSVDVIGALTEHGLELGRDYVAFLDSTIARFWADDWTLEKITPVLQYLDHGNILTRDDLVRLRLGDLNERYGRILFLADPGYIFFPNYFQKDTMVRGMHGYDPEGLPDHTAIIAGTSTEHPFQKDGPIHLADVAATLFGLLDLEIPEDMDGQSLLEAHHTAAVRS